MGEFDLIATYFTWDVSPKESLSSSNQSTSQQSIYKKNTQNKPHNKSNKTASSKVIKSVGDDAAVLSLAPNQQLVTSIDTLVSGVHFPVNTPPADIGYKALAVNLSDLAAMGATPEWFTLALTLPEIDHDWLSEFSRGLKALAEAADIALVGGDTTSGPLSISIQVMGSVETGKALYRNGAKQGDKVYVTGTLGDGAAGLLSLREQLKLTNDDANYCQQRLNRPTPRLDESNLLKDFASAAIDISDGLLQDLTHILKQSNLSNPEQMIGAELDLFRFPFSKALKSIDSQQALEFALAGGDDYELLFTIPEAVEAEFLNISKLSDYSFTCIGTITNIQGIVDTNKTPLNATGFNHFS